MKRYNTRATLAPTMATMKSNQDTASLVGALKSLVGGIGGGIEMKRKGIQAADTYNELDRQYQELDLLANDPKLDPLMRQSYKQQLGRLAIMGTQLRTDPNSIDDVLKSYTGMYDKMSDPLGLANALQIANIGASASRYGADTRANAMIEASKNAGFNPFFGQGYGNVSPVGFGALPAARNPGNSAIGIPDEFLN